MKKYINTSNYYLSTITSKIEVSPNSGTFDILDVTVDGVTLPEKGYYWVDVDFGDVSKREIFRIKERNGYTLTYDKRISPYGKKEHSIGATVALRDFSELLNSLSTNTDNFGEVEITGDLSVLVRGGNIYLPGNTHAENGKVYIDDKPFTFDTNTTSYIVLEYEYIEGVPTVDFFKKTGEELLETGQYPIAKIVAGNTRIEQSGITDLRANIIGQGNMRSEVYDPHPELHEGSDVFNYENFYNVPVATDWDISDISDREGKRAYWNAKQQQLIGEGGVGAGQNIKTIAGQNILGDGDISLDTILTVGWAFEDIPPETIEYQFHNIPLSNDAFIIMNNSGQVLVEGEEGDYNYDSATHTVIFPDGTPTSEEYRAWIMYDNSEGGTVHVGSGIVTVTCGEVEEEGQMIPKVWEFNVNQDGPCDINLTSQVTGMINTIVDETLGEVETLLEQI